MAGGTGSVKYEILCGGDLDVQDSYCNNCVSHVYFVLVHTICTDIRVQPI